MNNEIKNAIDAFIEKEYSFCKKKEGYYEYEMYADYNDELSDKEIAEILQSGNPREAFLDKLVESYDEAQYEYEKELINACIGELEKDLTGELLLEADDDEIKDYILEKVAFVVPEDHFLNQEVYTNIFVDTGDGNYDYTLNSLYPSYNGERGERINPKASLVWLAKQQGYTKTQLQNILKNGLDHEIDYRKGETKFLDSVYVEVLNEASHMNMLAFLVRTNIKELIEINELISLQTAKYDNSENPDCGTITLDKGVMCGLYDAWSGGGSTFDIVLEKDVELPIKFIRSALPDGCDGQYSVEAVYGMCGSAWINAVKNIKPPKTTRVKK